MRHWDSTRRRREVALADEVWREAHEGIDEQARVRALRSCLELLPERGQRMLRRTYAEGVGRAELGRELGMRPNGVKAALRRLRSGLERCIQRRLER